MPITEEERKYLKNKHKGGRNNSKGAIYENFYATYQIAVLIDRYLDQMEFIYLSSQINNSFVDDLLIKDNSNKLVFHQLKDVQNISWSTGKKHSLCYDFKRQTEILNENNEIFKLKLVYSNEKSSVSSIPRELLPSTSAEHFPACASINQLLLSFPQFRNAMKNIMVQNNATDDELSGAACAILGSWSSIEQNNVSLAQISDLIFSNSKGYVNIKAYPTVRISEVCKKLFHAFGIKFYENGLMVYWEYNKLKGEILWSDEIEKRLEENEITDIWSLIEEISC